jgi:hypothetical protein
MEIPESYDPNSLEATRPLEIDGDTLIMRVYGQDGTLNSLPVRNTRHNRQVAVWLRKFDRRGGGGVLGD